MTPTGPPRVDPSTRPFLPLPKTSHPPRPFLPLPTTSHPPSLPSPPHDVTTPLSHPHRSPDSTAARETLAPRVGLPCRELSLVSDTPGLAGRGVEVLGPSRAPCGTRQGPRGPVHRVDFPTGTHGTTTEPGRVLRSRSMGTALFTGRSRRIELWCRTRRICCK